MMKLFKSQELIHESMKHIDEVTRDNTTMKILDSEITINNIDNYINRFDSEYGVYDAVLERLFISADNNNYDNVFCRVGLLDLLYSTGIQRFNKGGIDIVTRHIMGLCQNIDAAKDAKGIDYTLFGKLEKVEYTGCISIHGRENNIPVFASKFMSFTNPTVYPIMDSIVKKVIGIREDAKYEEYCENLERFINEKIYPLGKRYTLKNIDKFLWLYGKESKK